MKFGTKFADVAITNVRGPPWKLSCGGAEIEYTVILCVFFFRYFLYFFNRTLTKISGSRYLQNGLCPYAEGNFENGFCLYKGLLRFDLQFSTWS